MQTATNPQTGERIVHMGGQWVPFTQSASNPETGERLFLVEGQWRGAQPAAAQPTQDPALTGGIPDDFGGPSQVPQRPASTAMQQIGAGLRDFAETVRNENIVPNEGAGVFVNAAKHAVTHPLQTLSEIATTTAQLPGRFYDGLADATQGAIDRNPEAVLAGSLAAGTAGAELALTVGSGGTAQAGRQVARQAARNAGSSSRAAFERVGVDPSAAALSNGQGPRALASSISENALAGAGVRANTRRQLGQAEEAVNRTADAFGGAISTAEAGEIVLSGVGRTRANAGKLYDAAFSRVDRSAQAQIPNTERAIGEALNRFDNPELASEFAAPVLQRLQGIIGRAGGRLTVRDIREMRTEVRLARNKTRLETTPDDRALAILERDLTQDMYDAVRATSGDRALARLQAADRYYRESLERVYGSLRNFAKEGQTEEGAFREIVTAMQGQTTSRGRGDFRKLRDLRRSLTPDEMGQVASGIIRSSGRATEGADFSVSVFANNWSRMGERQKDIVFGAQGPLREALDDLAVVTGKLAEVQGQANFSRSGVSVQNVATIGGLTVDPLTTVTALLGQAAVGDVLSNPRYVRAMANIADRELRAVRLEAARQNARAEAHRLAARSIALNTVNEIERSNPQARGAFDDLRARLNNLPGPQTQGLNGQVN